jgi:hypothetical protein
MPPMSVPEAKQLVTDRSARQKKHFSSEQWALRSIGTLGNQKTKQFVGRFWAGILQEHQTKVQLRNRQKNRQTMQSRTGSQRSTIEHAGHFISDKT